MSEELNKFIHEKVMGKCWHEDGEILSVCKCGAMNGSGYPGDWRDYNPSYTTDLNAVAEAERVTAEKFGAFRYIAVLAHVGDAENYALSDALTRCKAIQEVWSDKELQDVDAVLKRKRTK